MQLSVCRKYHQKEDAKPNMEKQNTFRMQSAFLYFLGLSMGIAIMAVYTQLVIKSQVESLVRKQEERYQDIKEDLNNIDLQKSLLMASKSINKSISENFIMRQKRHAGDHGAPFTAAHLVGYTGPNVRGGNQQIPQPGNYFRWFAGGGNSFSYVEVEETASGTFIVINRRGYYLVYSQVTYSGYGHNEVGHETVRIEPRGQSSLMISVTTQQLQSAKSGTKPNSRAIDSGYHSGIFYLNSGDKIGVKPRYSYRDHTYVSVKSAFYFGVCFLHGI